MLVVFLDKVVKLWHVALLHPREYTVDYLRKFIATRKWAYITEMFTVLNELVFYGQTEVKLAICRFIAEYLLRLAPRECTYLDEMMGKYDWQSRDEEQDMTSYGSFLLMEMAKMFKQMYVAKDGTRTDQNQGEESENYRVDIATCLSILLASCQSAKTMAMD